MATFTGQAFIRKRHVMMRENGSIYQSCASIGEAKRLSRTIQSLGGKVTVDRAEDPKPKRYRQKGDAADKFIAEAVRQEQADRVAKAQSKKGPNTLGLRKQA